MDKQVSLPSTVGVRRRNAENRTGRRRSERVREWSSLGAADPDGGSGAPIVSPICSDSKRQNQTQQGAEPETVDPIDNEEYQHSTPEPVPSKRNKHSQPGKKQTQQQPRTKPDPVARKPERGRKPERAPLKKPWENPKPRARSKSRNRSATRAKTAPPTQGNKLNTSLGFNDTFDFDCEESVHVTPFRAKAEDNPPATPISEELPQKASVDSTKNESSSSFPSSESEDSLYVPKKTGRRRSSPEKRKVISTRRGRPSTKENIPPKKISGEHLPLWTSSFFNCHKRFTLFCDFSFQSLETRSPAWRSHSLKSKSTSNGCLTWAFLTVLTLWDWDRKMPKVS